MDRWKDLTEIAEAVVDETLAGLPDEIKPFAANVPLQLEKRPSPAMMEEGITEDTLGLFIGESLEDVGSTTTPMPGQIFLFLENIWPSPNTIARPTSKKFASHCCTNWATI